MSSKKKRAFRRFGIISLIVLLLASFTGYVFIKPLPDPILAEQQLTVASNPSTPLSWPGFGQSAVGAVGYGVLATSGNQTPLATASIAKVLTALAVLKQKPLQAGESGPSLTMDQTDVDDYNRYVAQDGSVVPVEVGEQISEYQVLQAMLLPSANNMADSLARWAFGSVDAYITYANSYTQQLGLSSFHIADDASGFSPATVASAQDLTRLGELALANPVIASIVSQSTATIPVAGQINNVDVILGSHGIVGIKTGNNDVDLGAFLFAAQRSIDGSDVTVVGAVMGADTLGTALNASIPLIDSAASNFSKTSILTDTTTVGHYRTPWQSQSVAITPQTTASLISWSGEHITFQTHMQQLHVPSARGTVVGSLTATSASGHKTVSVPLRLAASIPKPSFLWRLQHVF